MTAAGWIGYVGAARYNPKLKIRKKKHMAEKNPISRNKVQLVWGIALMMAGVGVFVRIPQVMPKLAQMEYFSSALWLIRFCFYLMGIILLGGGLKKVLGYFRS